MGEETDNEGADQAPAEVVKGWSRAIPQLFGPGSGAAVGEVPTVQVVVDDGAEPSTIVAAARAVQAAWTEEASCPPCGVYVGGAWYPAAHAIATFEAADEAAQEAEAAEFAEFRAWKRSQATAAE
jgi:hypothetical protein